MSYNPLDEPDSWPILYCVYVLDRLTKAGLIEQGPWSLSLQGLSNLDQLVGYKPTDIQILNFLCNTGSFDVETIPDYFLFLTVCRDRGIDKVLQDFDDYEFNL